MGEPWLIKWRGFCPLSAGLACEILQAQVSYLDSLVFSAWPLVIYFPCVDVNHLIYKTGVTIPPVAWFKGRHVPLLMLCKRSRSEKWGAFHTLDRNPDTKPGEFTDTKLENLSLFIKRSVHSHLNCRCIPLKLADFLADTIVIESLAPSVLKWFWNFFPQPPDLQLKQKNRDCIYNVYYSEVNHFPEPKNTWLWATPWRTRGRAGPFPWVPVSDNLFLSCPSIELKESRRWRSKCQLWYMEYTVGDCSSDTITGFLISPLASSSHKDQGL